jgi:hypothetical protein
MSLVVINAAHDPVDAQFTGTLALSATATVTVIFVSADFTGTGTLTATARPSVAMAAGFTGTGTLAAAAVEVEYVPGSPAGSAVVADNGAADSFFEEVLVDFDHYPSDVYKFFVFDILTDTLLAELQMDGVSFSSKIAAAGELSGQVFAIEALTESMDLYWATMPMKTAIYVLRGEQALWGGIIWSREYDALSKTVSISAASWESYLYRRYIWHTYATKDTEDQYDVVRSLLIHMRSDFYKVYDSEDYVNPVPASAAVDIFAHQTAPSGEKQSSLTFLREEMKSFGEAIEEFANNLGGFEWYFYYEYNKKAQRFRRRLEFLDTPPALTPKGKEPLTDTEADKPGIDTYIFSYPGNIITLKLTEDAENACTRQFVVGGPPEGVSIEGYKPVGSWNNTEFLNQGFPLVESVESSKHATTSNQKRLNNLATVYGRETAPPIRRWDVTINGSVDPIVGTYHVGQWCRLVIDDPFIKQSLEAAGLNQELRGVVKRIVGITVNVPTGPQLPETVTLELEDDVVVGFEAADTVDADGNPLPVSTMLYPSGDLVAYASGAAGTPGIVGAHDQWSDAKQDTYGVIHTWRSGADLTYAANAISARLPAQNVSMTGKTVTAMVNMQGLDQGVAEPYVVEIRHRTTGVVCMTAHPTAFASLHGRFPQYTMVETGGGLASFETWLASGDAEVRIEAGHKSATQPTVNTKYRLRIYEVRFTVA